jgi:hypothetical protein
MKPITDKLEKGDALHDLSLEFDANRTSLATDWWARIGDRAK